MYDKTCGSESRKRSTEARVRGDHPTGMGMRDKGELCVSMSSGAGSRAVRRHKFTAVVERRRRYFTSGGVRKEKKAPGPRRVDTVDRAEGR